MAHSALNQIRMCSRILPGDTRWMAAKWMPILPSASMQEGATRYQMAQFYTTVGDLRKFCSFIMDDGSASLLKAAAWNATSPRWKCPQVQNLTTVTEWDSRLCRDHYVAVGHGGAVAGYQAALYMNRDKHFGLIVLVNALGPGTVSAGDLALSSLDLVSR